MQRITFSVTDICLSLPIFIGNDDVLDMAASGSGSQEPPDASGQLSDPQ
jgi:hypothetical protein